MEGWRKRRLGSKTRNSQGGRRKTDLTLTGLLMEGVTRLKKGWLGQSNDLIQFLGEEA
jgi:hypothetical protein